MTLPHFHPGNYSANFNPSLKRKLGIRDGKEEKMRGEKLEEEECEGRRDQRNKEKRRKKGYSFPALGEEGGFPVRACPVPSCQLASQLTCLSMQKANHCWQPTIPLHSQTGWKETRTASQPKTTGPDMGLQTSYDKAETAMPYSVQDKLTNWPLAVEV